MLKTEIDADNDATQVARVQELFAKYGFPSRDEVDEATAKEFVVLLVQDQPLAFMQKASPAVRAAVNDGRLPAYSEKYFEANLRQKAAKAALGKPTDPELKARIEAIFKGDQAVRQTEGFDPAKMRAKDDEDRSAVQSILDTYGMPTFSRVGAEAATDFVVLIQHQPASFRERALPKLKENVDVGQAWPKDFAMMYDRSQTDQGKPEVYGVNLVCQPNGTLAPGSLVDPEHVEDRRAAIGLMPLTTYVHMAALIAPPKFCALTSRTPVRRRP